MPERRATADAPAGSGPGDPVARIDEVYDRIEADGRPGVWISLVPRREARRRAEELAREGPAGRPLYGVAFAVKDNIDVAGMATTAACPARTEPAAAHAPVVARLLDAGAVLIGKTNLDQFATGLTGTRSPYGIPDSVVAPGFIAGGSSSGSAVAVAAGYAAFALGTDTAGSGRVPAACNGIVGLKPTRGIVSTRGVLPACRSFDSVSIFAPDVAGAVAVLDVIAAFDPADPYSRRWDRAAAPAVTGDDGPGAATAPPGRDGRSPAGDLATGGRRVGVPRRGRWEFFGDVGFEKAYQDGLTRLEGLGAELVEIDLDPFVEAGRLLYGTGLVAERLTAIGPWLASHPDAVHPVVAEILRGAERFTGADVHAARHRLAELRRDCAPAWVDVDVLALPTTGTTFTIEEALADPIGSSMNLGHYTNFVNLLDLCAVAFPAGARSDGVPFGLTLVAPAHHDLEAAALAARFTGEAVAGARSGNGAAGAHREEVLLVVVGAHLRGQPLEHQLLDLGGRFLTATRTAPCYRLFALRSEPPKPGLVRVEDGGASIEAEVWALPVAGFGAFVAAVPSPLAIGTVHLADGWSAPGFLCESVAAYTAPDITETGGWRAYLGVAT
ncbi:MAG: allophanate hydrolase [Actinomycetota bacterium]|jgi:allophanate hydrolase|nr:allophanate hydrolase [Actinomycetota bacterium]